MRGIISCAKYTTQAKHYVLLFVVMQNSSVGQVVDSKKFEEKRDIQKKLS